MSRLQCWRLCWRAAHWQWLRYASKTRRSAGSTGAANGSPVDLMVCLARLMRWAIVASGTRNAAAICAVVSPPSARRVSAIWLGGDSAGTRLATPVAEGVHKTDLIDLLNPVLARYHDERNEGEAFGDWIARAGITQLEYANAPRRAAARPTQEPA